MLSGSFVACTIDETGSALPHRAFPVSGFVPHGNRPGSRQTGPASATPSAHSNPGFAGATARQFLWFNRFANPGAFQLEEIWVLFPASPDVPVNGAVQLVVYFDTDIFPTNGAQWVATFDEVIQAADGTTFSVYTLPYPVSFAGGGDVLIGVINRYFTFGDPPPTQPAALDVSTPQNRSYFALWAADPPDPADLATATSIEMVGGAVTGNFMIRAFGRTLRDTAIPTLSVRSIVLLVLLLAGVGLWRLRSAS